MPSTTWALNSKTMRRRLSVKIKQNPKITKIRGRKETRKCSRTLAAGRPSSEHFVTAADKLSPAPEHKDRR